MGSGNLDGPGLMAELSPLGQPVAGADILLRMQRLQLSERSGAQLVTGRAITTDDLPVEGRDEWIAAVERLA